MAPQVSPVASVAASVTPAAQQYTDDRDRKACPRIVSPHRLAVAHPPGPNTRDPT
jgi:hypothetical protein